MVVEMEKKNCWTVSLLFDWSNWIDWKMLMIDDVDNWDVFHVNTRSKDFHWMISSLIDEDMLVVYLTWIHDTHLQTLAL